MVTNYWISGLVCAGLLSALLVLLGPGQSQAMEVKAFAIGDFVPSGSGGCNGGDRPTWPVMVDAWYDEMNAHGHTKDGQYNDGSMRVSRFCDPDVPGISTGCRDYVYPDEADAAMFATHGSDSGDHWRGTMRWPWNGDCRIDGGGAATEIYLGDIDLEYWHLSSCNSADDENLDPPGSNRGVREMMRDPFDGGFINLFTGFHGVMYIGGSYVDDYEDFADDAHSVGMAYAWAVNHYRSNSVDCEWYDPFNWWGTCQDICPVAVSQGQSAGRAWLGIQYERYNNVYSEPTGSGYWYWMGYPGCNSVNEGAFNP